MNDNSITMNKVTEQERMEVMTLCVRGTERMVKYGRRGKPHSVRLQVSVDFRKIEWTNPEKRRDQKKAVDFLNVIGVVRGRDRSKIFRRFPDLHEDECSFYLEYYADGADADGADADADVVSRTNSLKKRKKSASLSRQRKKTTQTTRTLNLVAESESARDKWVVGIETALLISKGLFLYNGNNNNNNNNNNGDDEDVTITTTTNDSNSNNNNSNGALRLKYSQSLVNRERQSFRVDVNNHANDDDGVNNNDDDDHHHHHHNNNNNEKKQHDSNNITPIVAATAVIVEAKQQQQQDSPSPKAKDGADFGVDVGEHNKINSSALNNTTETEQKLFKARSVDTEDFDRSTQMSSSIYSEDDAFTSSYGNSRKSGQAPSSTGRGSLSQELTTTTQKIHFSRPKDIYIWGKFQGLAGEEIQTSSSSLSLIPSIRKGFEHLDPVKISAGRSHFIAISKGGVLYYWGDTQKSQCGDSLAAGNLRDYRDQGNVPYPMRLSFPTDDIHQSFFIDCACGDDYSLALTRDGEIKAWGTTGWVEKGSFRVISVPISLECLGARKVTKISCGPVHCAAICDFGESVYTWGEGVFFALGHGNDSRTLARPKRVEALVGKTVTAISCGAWHTMACVKDNGAKKNSNNKVNNDEQVFEDAFGGDVYAWGDGSEGQLGCRVDSAIKVPTKISITVAPTTFSSSNGENAVSELTYIASTSIMKVACGAAYTILMSANGDVFISGKLGKYSSKEFEIIPELSRAELGNNLIITQIESGQDYCMFVASSRAAFATRKGSKKTSEGDLKNKLFAIGNNKFGKIGDGSLREAAIPVEIVSLGELSIKSLTCGGNVTAAIVAAGSDKKNRSFEKKTSTGGDAKKKEKKGGLAKLKSFAAGAAESKRTSVITTHGEKNADDGRNKKLGSFTLSSDDSIGPSSTKGDLAAATTLRGLSASLRSLASPRTYDIITNNNNIDVVKETKGGEDFKSNDYVAEPPSSPTSPIPMPRKSPPPQPSVIRSRNIMNDVKSFDISKDNIHPAPSLTSKERLVQLVERNVQDARRTAEAREQQQHQKKEHENKEEEQKLLITKKHQSDVLVVSRHSRQQQPLNPAFNKKIRMNSTTTNSSDVDIVKTPLSATLTRTTSTRPPSEQQKLQAQKKATAVNENISTPTKTITATKEWVEEVEAGVFMTFSRIGESKILQKVRFSKKVFNDKEAKRWWEENKQRFKELII